MTNHVIHLIPKWRIFVTCTHRRTLKSKMVVTRDDLGRAARKRGIEGQVTTIRHFGISCMH